MLELRNTLENKITADFSSEKVRMDVSRTFVSDLNVTVNETLIDIGNNSEIDKIVSPISLKTPTEFYNSNTEVIDDDELFNETKPYINSIMNINDCGFFTCSSQPGHGIDEYNVSEHSYYYGYGYIDGYINNDTHIINTLVKLSFEYIVIIQNVLLYRGKISTYSDIPVYPIGNNKGECLFSKDNCKLSNPTCFYTHTFPEQYQKNCMLYVIIKSPYHGKSNIFKDVENVLNY